MGGAGAAFPTDIGSALLWNPATTTKLAPFQLEATAEYFMPRRSLRGTVESDAFGPGVPATRLAGTTQSDANNAVLPGLAGLWRHAPSQTTFAIAVTALAGFGVEYDSENPPSPGSNPLVSAQPPAGLGFGRIQSDYQLMTLSAGVARPISSRLSIGFTAVTAMARFKLKPAAFAVPDDANGDSFFTYPSTNGFDEALGGGFRVGLQFEAIDGLFLGLSYASPIWFEEFEWGISDELGASADLDFGLDFPAKINVGLSYQFTQNLRIETDLRWIDYANTDGFRRDGYGAAGEVRGFGWKSILVFALGAEYEIGEIGVFRAGYNFGENPIPSNRSFFNAPAPAIVEHHFTVGAGIRIAPKITFDIAYYHGLKNADSGSVITPSGAVDGTRVRHSLTENSISFGLSFRRGEI
ncbi:MAG: OmpP1/FadL family transporter [Myxococcota bacterium]